MIEASTQPTIERIVQSDALTYEAGHTAWVTLLAPNIRRERFVARGVSPRDGLHAIQAARDYGIGTLRGSAPGIPATAS